MRRMPTRRWTLLLSAMVAPLVACQLLVGLGEPPTEPVRDDAAVAAGDADAATGATDAPSSSGYAAAVLADQPVAYYRLDEKAGAACADSSGNGNTANLGGAFVRARPTLLAGGDGASVHLGDGAGLVLDPKLDFDFTRDYTFELWFRGDAAGGDGQIFGNIEGVGGDLSGTNLYLKPTFPFVGFERWAKTLVRYCHVEQAVVPGPGNALFVAVVSRAGTPTIFVNGVGYVGHFGATSAAFVARSLFLGRLAGDYGELAIYDKALGDVRIAAHYALGRGN